jgi:uncharacterized membrane protein YobD (UPF0266 family)
MSESSPAATVLPIAPSAPAGFPLAPRNPRAFWLLVALITLAGIAVRVIPTSGFPAVGFDASLYRGYVLQLDEQGLAAYPRICKDYVKRQKSAQLALLPPTRFLYIFCGYVWKRAIFGDAPPIADIKAPGALRTDPVLRSLRGVSTATVTLLFLLSGVAAWRMLGRDAVPGVLALFAFAPVQVHMAQNLLIDGFVAFWAMLCLWLLWENFRHPRDWRWLAALALSMALMVLVKENAAFVFAGLGGIVVLNRWAKMGAVTPWLLLVMALGPLLGVLALMELAGGWKVLFKSYELLVSKASAMPYAIATGDGPWHRYLLDILASSPLVTCLAIAAVFCAMPERPALVFLFAFLAFSYALMCNVRYGMNLRYSTIWDLSIRTLAFAQIAWWLRGSAARPWCALALIVAGCAWAANDLRALEPAGWMPAAALVATAIAACAVWRLRDRPSLLAAALIAFLSLYDLRQYYLISIKGHAHELTPRILLRSLNILKPGDY